MDKKYDVTLTWSQLWEIRNLLEEEISSLNDSVFKADEQNLPDCVAIVKSRLDAVVSALNALPEL